ncbi:hypothetical protein WOSG25_080530 [Weissella oryzae SG25]|uniref:Uncharacterized protein n=1 Tax=Weissella oryzae (strain DSM 25784 / JCM 18191 / LMG 30913 / SG25) TaxID=1329250 RepID=A0A069D1J4_WEIOS|nr:hypothetical protein [Weissella oryzae]GAK31221.1 hypothetical protein WOSG25_080530 [Weissella oryzae SG25]
MDYKKDYDWQQEKTRQISVAREIKNNYANLLSIKFKNQGVKMGSGAISYDVELNDSHFELNGVSYFGEDNINSGGSYDPQKGKLVYGKTVQKINVSLSDGEVVKE